MMDAKELLNWIEENAYKFEPHETAQSDGEMVVLTEAHMEKIASMVATPGEGERSNAPIGGG